MIPPLWWAPLLAAACLLAGVPSAAPGQSRAPLPPLSPAPWGSGVVLPAGRPVASEASVRPPGRLLGTFYPEPMVNIMGSGPARGGYAPLGMYGLNSMAMVGPQSVYRVKAAPVTIYSRGYDGSIRQDTGISFSYPNFPIASPVVYPTRGNYYYGFPTSGVPPWWVNASNWIDQN